MLSFAATFSNSTIEKLESSDFIISDQNQSSMIDSFILKEKDEFSTHDEKIDCESEPRDNRTDNTTLNIQDNLENVTSDNIEEENFLRKEGSLRIISDGVMNAQNSEKNGRIIGNGNERISDTINSIIIHFQKGQSKKEDLKESLANQITSVSATNTSSSSSSSNTSYQEQTSEKISEEKASSGDSREQLDGAEGVDKSDKFNKSDETKEITETDNGSTNVNKKHSSREKSSKKSFKGSTKESMNPAELYDTTYVYPDDETDTEVVVLPHGETHDGDLFVTGKTVEVSGVVNGDLYVFGGQVFIDGTVNGSVICLAGTINHTGKVSQNVRILAGQIVIGGFVGGNVSILSGSLEVHPSTTIAGSLAVLSGNVDFAGVLNRNMRVYASNFRFSGDVKGDIEAFVGQMRITSRAEVFGSFEYWSNNEAFIDSSEILKKGIKHHPSFFYNLFKGKIFQSLKIGSKLATLLMNFFYSFVLGLVIMKFFPQRIKASMVVLNTKPLQALVCGIVILMVLPLACILLLITIIGAPFALTLLALNVIGFYTAKVFAILWVVSKMFKKVDFERYKKLYFVTGLVIYFLLTLIPYFGWILSTCSLLFGLGSVILGKRDKTADQAISP